MDYFLGFLVLRCRRTDTKRGARSAAMLGSFLLHCVGLSPLLENHVGAKKGEDRGRNGRCPSWRGVVGGTHPTAPPRETRRAGFALPSTRKEHSERKKGRR